MKFLIIKFQDYHGAIKEREISDATLESDTKIMAFCSLQQGRYSFDIPSIFSVIDKETGEVFENPYEFFGVSIAEDGRERLCSITHAIRPAMKALKFFARQLRESKKRDRDCIARFIKRITDTTAYTEGELDTFIHELGYGNLAKFNEGDTSEYTALLDSIPSIYRYVCYDTAMAIARGSGRKPIDQEIFNRIENDFVIRPLRE